MQEASKIHLVQNIGMSSVGPQHARPRHERANEQEKELKKLKSTKEERNAIDWFISNVKVCISKNQKCKQRRTQSWIGCNRIFKQWVVRTLQLRAKH